MELNIKSVTNGYILSWTEEEEEGKFIEHQEVIEEVDEEDLQGTYNLLHSVKDFFGYYYNKHNDKNIEINIK